MKNQTKKNRIKKVFAVLLVCMLTVSCLPMTASADVVSGLESAKNSLLTQVKTVLDNVVIPICLLIVAVVLLWNFMGFLRHRREGDGYQQQLVAMAITAAVGILFGTWYAWGGALLA